MRAEREVVGVASLEVRADVSEQVTLPRHEGHLWFRNFHGSGVG